MTEDRTAIVTGAGSARGIGRATCLRLAADGWHVAALDVDGDGARETAELAAGEHGVQALGVACDVAREEDVERAIAELEAGLPPVGALVNNAGISAPTPFLEIEPPEWDRMFEVNVRGTYLVTRRVAPGMVERGHGRIVMLSSVSAIRGGGIFGASHYSASKAALLGLARAIARELGPHGVTCNAIAPGLIDTDIAAGKMTPERRSEVLADVPVGRLGGTEDVAALIAYLVSDAGYLTGATVDLHGGSHIH